MHLVPGMWKSTKKIYKNESDVRIENSLQIINSSSGWFKCFPPECKQRGNEQKSKRKTPLSVLFSSAGSLWLLTFLGFRSGTWSCIHGDLDLGAGTCRARYTPCLHRGLGVAKGKLPQIPGSASLGWFPPGCTASLFTSGTFCHHEVWLISTGCGRSLWNSCLCLIWSRRHKPTKDSLQKRGPLGNRLILVNCFSTQYIGIKRTHN